MPPKGLLLHPSSRILIYLLAALVIPGLPFFMLMMVLLSALIMFLMLRWHPLALIWRTRWLILVLLLGYAYSLPGQPALPMLGAWSPSLEGLLGGGRQVLRLLLLLLWLDLLVLRLPTPALMGGLYVLMRPLKIVRLDARQFALRLGLTLRAIESLERGRGNLLRLMAEDAGADLPERVNISVLPLRPVDVLTPGALLVAALCYWLCV